MATDVQQPDIVVTGNITTAGGPTDPNSYVLISCGEGYSTWSADMRGTFSSGTTLVFEGTLDSQNWLSIPGVPVGSVGAMPVTSVMGPGPLAYQDGAAGLMQLRIRATSLAGGDNILVTLRLSVGVETTPGGGGGGGGGGSVTQGTIPWLVAGQGVAGTPATGILTVQGITGGTPIPVTGSISATNPSVGLTGTVAPTSATEIGGVAPSGNLLSAGIAPGSTAATISQAALVVALSPNTPLPTGSNTIGAVTQSGAWSVGLTGSPSVSVSNFPSTFPSTQSGSWSVGITGTPTVSVGNFPATVAVTQSTSPWVVSVSGTPSVSVSNFPATQAVTQSGSWTVLQGGAPWSVDLGASLPAGTNAIGSVTVSSGAIDVSNFPATQAVTQSGPWDVTQTGTWTVDQGAPNSLANAWPVSLTDGSSVLGTGSNPLRIDPTGSTTQPVTGTGTAGSPASGIVSVQGIPGGTPVTISGSITATDASVGITGATAPLYATEVGGVDTTGKLQNVGVALGFSAPTTAQQALVVTISPNTPPISVAPVTVSGTVAVTQSTSPWVTQSAPQLSNSQEDPTSGAQINNLTSFGGLSSPSTAVNTGCPYLALGGEYYLNFTPASENLLGVFAYQVPVGHTLYITNMVLPPPVVTSDMAGGPCGQLWEMFIANGSNPAIATGVRFPIATFGATGGAFCRQQSYWQRSGVLLATESRGSHGRSVGPHLLQSSGRGLWNRDF
jgi:hypothetical protein